MEKEKKNKKKLSLTLKAIAIAIFLSQLGSCTYSCHNNLKHETVDFNDELDDEEIISVSDNDFDYSKTEKDNSGVNTLYVMLLRCGYDVLLSTRSTLATTLGIENYDGTILQDAELLELLKKGKHEKLVKVSEIENICRQLFGENSEEIIAELKLPETLNITRSEFARVVKEIAKHLSVDVESYKDKLYSSSYNINDIDMSTLNYQSIVWSYLMGYMELDEQNNFKGNIYLSEDEFNLWMSKFGEDYKNAKNNKKDNDKIIVIETNEKITENVNDIHNNLYPNSADDNNNNENNNHNHNHNENRHKHKYSIWKYYDSKREIRKIQLDSA